MAGTLAIVPSAAWQSMCARAADLVPGVADARVDDARAAMNNEQYPRAIELLRSVLAGNSRNSSAGRAASYLLITSLRVSGDYRGALAENSALLSVLDRPEQAQPDASLHADLTLNDQVLRDLISKDDALVNRAAQAHGSLRLLAQADLLQFRDKQADAFQQYIAAVDQALNDPALAQEDILAAVHALSHAWLLRSHDPEVKAAYARARSIARENSASPTQRLLGLTIVHTLELPSQAWPVEIAAAGRIGPQAGLGPLRDAANNMAESDALVVSKSFFDRAKAAFDARQFDMADNALMQTAPIEQAFMGREGKLGDQIHRIQDLRAWLPAAKAADDAVRLEIAGEYSEAAASYQRVADVCAKTNAPLYKDEIARLSAQANRSVPLLNLQAAKDAGDGSPCRFLGLDPTIGSDWEASVGSEAWVLFALHGRDLAGGPRILDGSFTYRASNADPANTVRRWRDPAGYQGRPNDVPLDDPAAGSSESAVAFLDDNGEDYPSGAGPDLALRISVPSGDHLLSIPLHFSDPGRAEAHYCFSLFTGDGGAARCVAATVVETPVSPSYLRAMMRGPSRYMLVVRRLDSENVNVPALFLDPAPSSANDPLTDEFSRGDLAEMKLDGSGSRSQNDGTAVGRLQGLIDTYVQGGGDPAVLASQAETLRSSAKLTEGQQVVAAYLTWRFLEQSPLQAGKRLPAFAQFITQRYVWAPGGETDNIPALMAQRADRLRKSGAYRYTEVVDDALWDVTLSRAREDGRMAAGQLSSHIAVFQKAWAQGPQRYLEAREARLTTGEDDPAPQTVKLALDPLYAAKKARLVTMALMAGDARVAESSSPPVTHVTAASAADAQIALGWVDTLGSELGVSPNGLKEQLSSHSAQTPVVQPAGAIIYAAASVPLLGGSPSASPGDPKSCLLRADQLEALARCYLGREAFPSDTSAGDAGFAARILDLIETGHSDYNRLALVQPLAASLRPAR